MISGLQYQICAHMLIRPLTIAVGRELVQPPMAVKLKGLMVAMNPYKEYDIYIQLYQYIAIVLTCNVIVLEKFANTY